MIRRSSILQGELIVLWVFLLNGLSLFAQEENPTGPEAGRALAAEMRTLRPAEDAKWRGVLKVRGHGQKTTAIPILCQTTSESNSTWQVMYLTSASNIIGSEKLTVIHSPNGLNQYVYAKAPSPGAPLGEPRSLSGAQAEIPLAGSDFWLADLGFEFYHWPQQRRLKGEMRRGRPCYVLESVNPQPTGEGYSRVRTWIDKESGAPLLADAYGRDGRLLKEFSPGRATRVNGHWELKSLGIENLKTGSRTTLVFDRESVPADEK